MSKPKASVKPKGRTLEEFREMHDKSYIVPKRIKAGLAELGESWEYEAEFIRRCRLSTGDFAAYRDQFKDFFLEPRINKTTRNASVKRVWCGTVAYTNKCRANMS